MCDSSPGDAHIWSFGRVAEFTGCTVVSTRALSVVCTGNARSARHPAAGKMKCRRSASACMQVGCHCHAACHTLCHSVTQHVTLHVTLYITQYNLQVHGISTVLLPVRREAVSAPGARLLFVTIFHPDNVFQHWK